MLGGDVRQSGGRRDLSHLPASDAQQEANHIGLLLLLDFFHVLEGTHLDGCKSEKCTGGGDWMKREMVNVPCRLYEVVGCRCRKKFEEENVGRQRLCVGR